MQNGQSRASIRNTPWCNGNTAPFGGVILGSNPSGVANLSRGTLPMRNGSFEDTQRTEPKRKNSPTICQVFGNHASTERSDRLRQLHVAAHVHAILCVDCRRSLQFSVPQIKARTDRPHSLFSGCNRPSEIGFFACSQASPGVIDNLLLSPDIRGIWTIPAQSSRFREALQQAVKEALVRVIARSRAAVDCSRQSSAFPEKAWPTNRK
jgi:hypothetical protein